MRRCINFHLRVCSTLHYDLQAGSAERLVSQMESATTASSSSFLCHVHCAWLVFTTSNRPWPKLASLKTEIGSSGSLYLKSTVIQIPSHH